MSVAVLFARRDSNYKKLAGIHVYDEDLDARTFGGGRRVVAHPPCRAWGRLRHFAKPLAHEKDLARYAVAMVRQCGGVLEHPESSVLWDDQGLPKPQRGRDAFGGWTLPVEQWWWGHRAQKKTWLYIVGCEPADVPTMPLRLGKSDCVIRLDTRRADGSYVRKGDPDYKPRLDDAEREHTPPAFAAWLVELASRCTKVRVAA